MDTDNIKSFFVSHFEKIALGGIVAVSGFLVYQGTQLPDFTDEKTPEQLSQQAQTVKLGIDDDHTSEIIESRKPLPGDSIVTRTKQLYKPVDPTTYKLSKIWVGEASGDAIIRRQDPLLLPPIDLRTIGVVCAIAANGAREVDGYPLAKLEGADDLAAEEAKRPRSRGRRSRRGVDDEMGMSDEMMDMMGPRRGRRGEDEDQGPVFNRKFDGSLSLGYTPTAGDAQNKSNYPQPKIGWFIAGTALLPHREIYEAYELAFKDASGYDPMRDTPLYYDFEVQRADVTSKNVQDLTEEDWSKVYDRSLYTKIADAVWQGFAPELVPDDYRDDNITTWIPPVLLDDYSYFALHPRIPKLSRMELENLQLLEEEKNDRSGEIDLNDLDFQNDQNELAGPSTEGGMRGGGGDYMREDMGMNEDYGDMYSGGGMGMFSRGQVEVDPVEHKLIRFYDFGLYPSKARPGRKYSYRIRYAVIDPNFPALAQAQPITSKLSPDVAQRVMTKISEARESGKRNFRLWSEWSEPTLPDSLPTTFDAFAGSVERGKVSNYKVGDRMVPVARESASAKVLLSKFDFNLGVRVPVMVEAIKEGGVLNKTAEVAEVIDPITNVIHKVTDYKIESSISIVDLDGGVPLEMSEGLTSPGQMLLFDANGKLSVSNDVDDQRNFRVYSFAKEKESNTQ